LLFTKQNGVQHLIDRYTNLNIAIRLLINKHRAQLKQQEPF